MFNRAKFDELPVPVGARELGGQEIARIALVGDSLRVSLSRGFDDPITWGIALADVAHHVARMFEQEHVCSEQDALRRIGEVFAVEMRTPTDQGTTDEAN